MTSRVIGIGGRTIGAGHPPLVVAEMSGNHRGSLEVALEIVKSAADNGADAIKLQTFTPSILTIDSARPEFAIDDPASLWHGRRLWDLYAEAHTPWEWHEPIFSLARSRGLACISTAFDQSSLDFLLQLGVDAIKIASFELVHIPLIGAAARVGKPVLLSTGMASIGEIDDAVFALTAGGCGAFVLLKCTSAYPSAEEHANLLTMQALSSRYECEVGLSDHALRPYAAYAAVALGATVVEKHFTLNRAQGGPDAAFSLEPSELRELVDGTKRVWQSRGKVEYGPHATEKTSLKERPSIYVVLPVKKGEPFTAENLRVIRPGSGLSPKHYRSILGRRSSRDIEAEIPVAWDMVE